MTLSGYNVTLVDEYFSIGKQDFVKNNAVANYVISGNDPAVGCLKDFTATYQCGSLPTVKTINIPGEAFGTPGYIRLSYALGDDDLIEGISRVQDLLK